MTAPLLAAEHLSKSFGPQVKAVDDVSLSVAPGEILGIVGESGSGKSTTAKMLLGLLRPDSGTVRFEGSDLAGVDRAQLRRLRARLQVVPQNPQTSLNPRLRIGSSIEFNMRAHGIARPERRRTLARLLERVGLSAAYADRFPHELSGGQLQRVAIARALSTGPRLVICDEAVSALDKSVQAQVLNLLAGLQARRGIAMLFISHDLRVVRQVSHDVAVMYLGRVVEQGEADAVLAGPAHPYTRALVGAAPGAGRRALLGGDPPDPANVPPGCPFHPRCPAAVARCRAERPALLPLAGTERIVACHVAHGEAERARPRRQEIPA